MIIFEKLYSLCYNTTTKQQIEKNNETKSTRND